MTGAPVSGNAGFVVAPLTTGGFCEVPCGAELFVCANAGAAEPKRISAPVWSAVAPSMQDFDILFPVHFVPPTNGTFRTMAIYASGASRQTFCTAEAHFRGRLLL